MQNKNNEVELTIDDTIYTLEERIAQGGSGTVYRARAVDDEQSNVAIKIVRDSDQGLLFLDRSGDVRKGITRESGLLKRLNQLESQHYLTLLNEGHRDGSGNYCFVFFFTTN